MVIITADGFTHPTTLHNYSIIVIRKFVNLKKREIIVLGRTWRKKDKLALSEYVFVRSDLLRLSISRKLWFKLMLVFLGCSIFFYLECSKQAIFFFLHFFKCLVQIFKSSWTPYLSFGAISYEKERACSNADISLDRVITFH